MLAVAGAVMTALVRVGCGSTPVRLHGAARLSSVLGRRVGGWTALTLADRCWAAAQERADTFDTRNGTTRFAARLREARSLVPRADGSTGLLVEHGGRLVRSSLKAGLPTSRVRDRDVFAPDTEGCIDPDDLLELARERAAAGDPDGAELVITRALMRSEPRTRAELFALRVRLLVEGGRSEEAERALAQKVDCLILDDLDDEAEVDLQLGLLVHGGSAVDADHRLEAGLARARELNLGTAARVRIVVALAAARVRQRRHADAESLLARELGRPAGDEGGVRWEPALSLLADVRCVLGRPAEAEDSLDRIIAAPVDRAMRASALLRRSLVVMNDEANVPLPGDGLFERAVDDADRALELFSELDHAEGILDSCGVLAELLGRQGATSGAIEALRTAHRAAVRLAHPDANAVAFRLSCALIRSDRGDQARSLLEDILDLEGVKGSVDARAGAGDSAGHRSVPDSGGSAELAVVLHWLGHACRHDDDDAAAYCAWSVALERFDRCGDELAGIEVGIALGRLLFDNDEESSIDVLHHAVRRAECHIRAAGEKRRTGPTGRIRSVSRASAQVLLIDALHLLGRAEAAFGHASGLASLETARAEAVRAGFADHSFEASILESRARALDDLGRESEAIALARQSAEAYRSARDLRGAAEVELFETRLRAIAAAPDPTSSVEAAPAPAAEPAPAPAPPALLIAPG